MQVDKFALQLLDLLVFLSLLLRKLRATVSKLEEQFHQTLLCRIVTVLEKEGERLRELATKAQNLIVDFLIALPNRNQKLNYFSEFAEAL